VNKWKIIAAGIIGLAIIGAMDDRSNDVKEQPTIVYTMIGQEDDPTWGCAVNGNHICGPNNGNQMIAGCYENGKLIIPWTNFDNPKDDKLYGIMPQGGRYPSCQQILQTNDDQKDDDRKTDDRKTKPSVTPKVDATEHRCT